MKVPANLPADRLILEYLSRVAAAGNRQLPKGKRMAFVSTTRNRIWREIGPGGTADPDRVREVLARLGEPEDLVMAERARLDAEAAERLERQAQKKEDAAAAAAAAAAASGTAPLQYRPRSPRPGPARPAGPQRRRPPDDRGDAGAPEGRPGRRGGPKEGKPRRRLGGLLADWQDRLGTRPAQPGGQAPPETVTGSPAGTAGQAPGSTTGQAPQGTAGQGPGTAAGPVPESTTGQAPQGTAGQAPQGTGGQAPQGTGGRGAEGTGGRGPGAAGGQGPSRFAHWIPGFADAQAPGGTAAPTTNGAGGHAAGEGPEGGGSDSARGQPANGVTPAGTGARQKGGTTPSGAGPPAEEEQSAFSRGTHALRGAAVTLGNGAVDLALDAVDLARQHKLETAAVLLLGVSGFIFVFPFWLVFALLGGVVAIWSQIWNARDKWVGLTGPPVIALVGTIVSALIIGGRGHFVGSYPEAFRLYVGYYYRAGSLLCAVYLALQARRGPQRRLPPWRR
jgi:hypothetical protein